MLQLLEAWIIMSDNKWCAAVLKVPCDKLDLYGDDMVDILNIRLS